MSSEKNRTHRVNLRLSDAEQELIQSHADAAGHGQPATFFREFVFSRLGVGRDAEAPSAIPDPILDDILSELHQLRMNTDLHLRWLKFNAEMTIIVGKMITQDPERFVEFMREQKARHIGGVDGP